MCVCELVCVTAFSLKNSKRNQEGKQTNGCYL